jgi:hypothetical protein
VRRWKIAGVKGARTRALPRRSRAPYLRATPETKRKIFLDTSWKKLFQLIDLASLLQSLPYCISLLRKGLVQEISLKLQPACLWQSRTPSLNGCNNFPCDITPIGAVKGTRDVPVQNVTSCVLSTSPECALHKWKEITGMKSVTRWMDKGNRS